MTNRARSRRERLARKAPALVFLLVAIGCGGAAPPLERVAVPPLPTMDEDVVLSSPLHFTETMEHEPDSDVPVSPDQRTALGIASTRPGHRPPVDLTGCFATCTADSSSPLPPADEVKIAARLKPLLGELHGCLTRIGGERIRPGIFLRFTEGGTFTNARFDLGGYEDLSCARELQRYMPRVSASRGTTVRCELRCDGGPPPAKRARQSLQMNGHH